MGLYDERLNELSEARRSRRSSLRSRPFAETVRRSSPVVRPATTESRRPSMDIQSLIFNRKEWSEDKAKGWAKSNGFKHGKTDVTDQHIRIRQFDPSGLKVKRTITLGRGIQAVVAREEDTAMKRRRTTKKASSRRTAKRSSAATAGAKPAFGSPAWRAMYPRKGKSKKRRAARESTVAASTTVAAPRRRKAKRRSTREATTVAAPRRRKARRARETTTVAAPRRRKARRYSRETTTVAAPRRRRARASGQVMTKRRRKVRATPKVRAWRGNSSGHSKAAKKGWKKRKSARRTTRESVVMAPRRRKSAKRRSREFTYESTVQSPRRRKSSHRRRRSSVREGGYRVRAPKSKLGTMAMKLGKLALFTTAAASSFVAVDWVDRYLATYNPAGDPAKLPADKFTSDGAGTLANTLNVASSPHVLRIVNAIGSTLLPALGSLATSNPYVRSSLEGMAVGAGVKAFSLFFSNVLMPMLGPKDEAALKDSHIARLYPAEVAAHMNLKSGTNHVSANAGALSGAPDVGPFAVGGPSPYPSAGEALRAEAGMAGPSPYPSAVEALQAGVDGPYGFRPAPPGGYRPAPPSHPIAAQWHGAHPMFRPGGYQHSTAWSQRWGTRYQSQVPSGHHHHHCMLRAKTMYPSYTDAQLHQWCVSHPYSAYPYLYVGVGADTPADAGALPPPPPPPPPSGGGAPPGPAPQMPVPTTPMPDPVGPPAYAPGPPAGPGPGPTPINQECGCSGNSFLGFIGDEEEKDLFFNSGK